MLNALKVLNQAYDAWYPICYATAISIIAHSCIKCLSHQHLMQECAMILIAVA